jgi:outer membrane protein OmpA-like peptidoglycan-associated protein
MKSSVAVVMSVLFLFLLAGAAAAQLDDKNCKDHPLFTRMPGSWIHSCQERQFDAFDFTVGPNRMTTRVEGQLWKINYYPNNDLNPKPSELQIQRNFQNAVQKQGGKIVWTEKSRNTYRLDKDGLEIWVELRTEFTGKYFLTIMQKQGMVQDIVVNAAALAQGLMIDGHMAVDGIYFDTGKAVIKPESAQAIEEIAKLLKADPALKVFVVGHTDSVSTVELNLKLSQDRAQAVLQALVSQHGIDAARLRAHGCGPFAPVASNATEAGRAKNRRVELVKQ